MGHKGHWGEYTGNAKWSRDHAHTRVTSKNYDDAVRDDAAHIDYLKRDINYDAKHGHNDENMTADEKHISKLAGDMKYDKEHHSPASALHRHTDKHIRREAKKIARKNEGDEQDIYYELKSQVDSDKKKQEEKDAAPKMSALPNKKFDRTAEDIEKRQRERLEKEAAKKKQKK